MSKIPAYKKLYSELKADIKNNKYPPGTLLPTEMELEKLFGVSRTTVRKATGLLTAEGYLLVRQGHGSEIQDPSTSQHLNGISSFTETLKKRGYAVTTQGFFMEKTRADNHLANILNIKCNDPIYHLQRIQCADGQPICIIDNYLVASLFPGFQIHETECISLYAYLEKNYGLILKSATETITAIAAPFIESQILHINVGSPLLMSKRVSYSDQGACEYAVIKVIADRYEYQIYLAGRV